mgnify:CR=1 FL=1
MRKIWPGAIGEVRLIERRFGICRLNQSHQGEFWLVLFCNRAKFLNVSGSKSLTWANGILADKIYCVFQGSC